MIRAKFASVSLELRKVIDGMNSVDEFYYKEPVTQLRNHELVDTGKYRFNERAFVTQLLNNIEKGFSMLGIHQNKYFQNDVPKQIILDSSKYLYNYRDTFQALFFSDEGEFHRLPDIVIHSGPNDFDQNNQVFISEIKINPMLNQNEFNIDLFKVNLYHEELGFRNSAFIILNVSVEKIKLYYERYIASLYFQSQREGIYLLIKPTFDAKVEIFKIDKP